MLHLARAVVTRWSSYRAHAQGEADRLLTEHALYRRLARNEEARQAAYRQLFRSQLGKADLQAIRDATNKAWALGNDGFRQKIEALAGRRTAPLPKSRPRRKKVESDNHLDRSPRLFFLLIAV